jgi:hypothetical protein
VLVVFVPVAFTHVRFCVLAVPVTVRFVTVAPPIK